MRQDAFFTLRELCQTLGVSRSGYYAHHHKAQRPRRQKDRQLSLQIAAAFEQSRRTYGTPRLVYELRAQGQSVGRRRIARLMRQQGLQARQKRRFVPRTTQSAPHRTPAPNQLLNRPAPQQLNEVWVTDLTYLPTKEGWLYLSAQMDLQSAHPGLGRRRPHGNNPPPAFATASFGKPKKPPFHLDPSQRSRLSIYQQHL